MSDGLISLYWFDLLTLIDYIISWLFKIAIVIILIKLYDYLNWK